MNTTKKTKKVEELTEAQKARFGEFVDKWTKIGLSTDPLDREACIAAVNLAYKCGGLEPPKVIHFQKSPVSAIRFIKNPSLETAGEYGRQMVHYNNGFVPGPPPNDPWSRTSAPITNPLSDMVFGCYDAGWLSFYDYMREVVGLVEETEKMAGMFACAKNMGWVSLYGNVAIIQQRPVAIRRDDQGRLHSVDKPVVEYSDDFRFYAYHGLVIPPSHHYVITDKNKITAEKIDEEQNAELRRVMLAQFTAERYLKESKGVQVLEEIPEDSPIKGLRGAKLFKKDPPPRLRDSNEEPVVMVMLNNSTPEPDGTIKQYMLRVPPNCNKVAQAVAWTWGDNLKPEDYLPAQET